LSSGSTLDKALREFEGAQANLVKLERIWNELREMMPNGIAFGPPNELYEDKLRSYEQILSFLPRISEFKPKTIPWELDDIAQERINAKEVGDFEAQVSVEKWIDQPRVELREYRFRLQNLRKQLVRNSTSNVIERVDGVLNSLADRHQIDDSDDFAEVSLSISDDLDWERLKDLVGEFNSLLGDSVRRPSRWGDLLRHLKFGKLCDLIDILKTDWPMVKESVWSSLSEEDDPISTEVSDLSELVSRKPNGPIATKLHLENLSDDDFERLIFMLISSEIGYENPEWLMNTHAADKGRDLSVTRVSKDSLSGFERKRVIIQCKHYLKTSISVGDISTLKEQVKLWEPPRIDVLVIATSGRFTSDAVSRIEQHNRSDSALKIEMWPESHIENLLASRPAIVGEFRLR